jgi:TolB-like protein
VRRKTDSLSRSQRCPDTCPEALAGHMPAINCVSWVKDKTRYPIFLGVTLSVIGFLLISIWGCGGGPKYFVRNKADVDKVKKVAVMPFEDFTSDEYAGEKIRRVVITELLLRGIDVVEPGEVTRVLKDSSAKSLSSVKAADMQSIGKALGVDGVITGSVEAFGMSKGISVTYPEVSIHLILLDVSSGNIIWSVQYTAGGASFWTRHFGSEGITLSEAARKAVKESIATLF